VFFFEKKNQNTFGYGSQAKGRLPERRRTAKKIKVFWFFFSKKNTSFYLPFGTRQTRVDLPNPPQYLPASRLTRMTFGPAVDRLAPELVAPPHLRVAPILG
jgi:hypothetical protein